MLEGVRRTRSRPLAAAPQWRWWSRAGLQVGSLTNLAPHQTLSPALLRFFKMDSLSTCTYTNKDSALHALVRATSYSGESLPRLHLTLTANNLARFTAFSRGGNNIIWKLAINSALSWFNAHLVFPQGEPCPGQWLFCIWPSDSKFPIFLTLEFR